MRTAKDEQEGGLQVAHQHGRAACSCCFVPCHLLPSCGRGLQAEACVSFAWAEENNRFCHDMDVRQQLSAAFTVSAFDVQVAVAMSRVLLIHGPLPKFAQLILMTRQAVINSSFKDGTLQNAPACMPDQVKVKHSGQPVIILGFSSN